jgi:hypothetical protein
LEARGSPSLAPAYALSDDFVNAASHLPEATERLRVSLRDLRRMAMGR